MTYAELEKLPASAYLDASNFRTDQDRQEELDLAYKAGLRIGKKAHHVYVSELSVFSCQDKNGRWFFEPLAIGQTEESSFFWQGILDSKVPFTVYRRNQRPTTFQ